MAKQELLPYSDKDGKIKFRALAETVGHRDPPVDRT